jgi:hypothetical protein
MRIEKKMLGSREELSIKWRRITLWASRALRRMEGRERLAFDETPTFLPSSLLDEIYSVEMPQAPRSTKCLFGGCFVGWTALEGFE